MCFILMILYSYVVNDVLILKFLDFLSLDHTKPHEQGVQFATRNLPVNNQSPALNIQQRSIHNHIKQLTAESDRTQDTVAPIGKYIHI